MKKAIVTCVVAFVFVQISVMAYLAACYPSAPAPEYPTRPKTKLVSYTIDNQAELDALSAYESKWPPSEQSTIHDVLISNADVIAANTGETKTEVLSEIDSLNIDNWEVARIPNDAVITNSSSVNISKANELVLSYFEYNGNEYLQISNSTGSVTLYVPEESSKMIEQLSCIS